MRMVIGSTTDPGIIRNYRCRPGLLGHTLVVAGGQGVGGRKWPQLSPDLGLIVLTPRSLVNIMLNYAN